MSPLSPEQILSSFGIVVGGQFSSEENKEVPTQFDKFLMFHPLYSQSQCLLFLEPHNIIERPLK